MARAVQVTRVMRMLMALVVVLAACQSKPEKKWGQGRTYDLDVTTVFLGEVPQGWRDVQDLEPSPGRRDPFTLLWPESFEDGEILVGPNPAVSPDGCVKYQDDFDRGAADTGKGMAWDTQPTTFGGDPGCTMKFAMKGKTGRVLIRSHGTRGAFVRCLGTAKDLDRACDAIVGGFRPLVEP